MVETPVSGNGAPGAINLRLAAQILNIAGFEPAAIAKALREIYGLDEIDVVNVETWLRAPLPVKVTRAPYTHTLRKEMLPALRYAVGAAIGDGDCYGILEVTDPGFANAYASAVATITGRFPTVRRRNGCYRVGGSRFIALLARGPLWRTVAYLDGHDEKALFLSGLLDAEGSVVPLVDKRHKNVRIRIQFVNTNREIALYVKKALERLGLRPRLVETRHTGGRIVHKKKVYKVTADTADITPLKKLELHCTRKRLLQDFFLSTEGLPPRERYEKFMRFWVKDGDKWMPRTWRRARRRITHRVLCPQCGKEGIIELRRDVVGTILRIYVLIIHENNRACEFEIAEKDITSYISLPDFRVKGSIKLIKCPKCGKPGHVALSLMGKKVRKTTTRLRVAVTHYGDKKTTCTLMYLPLVDIIVRPPPRA